LPAEPASVMQVMERLGSLQFDPLDVTGRNHDLVLAARIDGYRRAWTDDLLYRERALFEAYNKGLSLLPTNELPLHRLTWDRERAAHETTTFRDHAPLVDELLDRIRRDGPLAAADVEPRVAIDWYWRPTNQVRAILEALAESGILGLARRDGNRRVYDLVERLFPEAMLADRPPARDQYRHKLLSRYRAHGLLGRTGSAELWLSGAPATRKAGHDDVPIRSELLDELVEAGTLVPVKVDGVRGDRYILAEELPLLDAATDDGRAMGQPGAVMLAPLDPLVWDRALLRSLYDFDYVWEVYVPAAKRRWGYYVLPLLYGDRLVGRIEPRVDRRAGTLRIIGLWWEAGFRPLEEASIVAALVDALEAHARFTGATRIVMAPGVGERRLVAAIRKRLGRGGTLRP
jgi:uncharacterized protein YcaQ